MNSKLIGLLKSRKFWAAILSLGFLFLRAYVPNFPFSEDQALQVVLVVVGYIASVALEDGLSARRG